jgi:energy-coupling factor transport system permease protein
MKISLGSFYAADSPLHRGDPRVKLTGMLVLMVAIFLLNRPLALSAYAVFLVALILLSRIPLKVVLKSVRPILFILLFAFIVNLLTADGGRLLLHYGPLRITTGGLYQAIKFALRLLYLVLTSSLLLTLTTTPLQMADALEALLRPLSRIGVPTHEIAMMMSIALRFIPTLADEADKIMKAQSSRVADYDTGKLVAKAKGMVSMLIPLFVSAFKRADDLALAMEARCYRGGTGRTKLRPLRFKQSDGRLVFGLALALALILLTEYLPLFSGLL